MKQNKVTREKCWYGILIFLFGCTALPPWAIPLDSPDLDSWCEHRLVHPTQQREVFKAFKDIVEGADGDRTATVHGSATNLATLKFGIGADRRNLTLNIAKSQVNRDNIILYLKDDGDTIFKGLIHLPPLYVWKQFDEMNDPEISLPLTQNSWTGLGLGAVLENGFQMRKYVEIRRMPRRQLSITLGIDVDCDLVRNYTGGAKRKYILFRPGQYLCRVPVVVSLAAAQQNPD